MFPRGDVALLSTAFDLRYRNMILYGRSDVLGALLCSRTECMPTVAIEGQFRFVVNTRENGFEPPHVHIWVGNEDVCRIDLNGGTYMDEPPPGNFRDILTAYSRYAGDIRRTWDSIHGR